MPPSDLLSSQPTGSSARRRRIILLGATGSIGGNALRVIAAHPDRLELAGIAARSNWRGLAAVAREFGVREVAIQDEGACAEAARSGEFPAGTRLRGGAGGLLDLAVLPGADTVLVAIVGTTALDPTLAAIRAGRDIALASKEILVLAGRFVMDEVARHRVRLLPVDSEHNAVFQCLGAGGTRGVRRVILTASGGAFRDWPVERLAEATPADALRHPNWAMGPKITVDAATLANKGLELIEAQQLFNLRPDQCAAVIHPQSIVHCLVEFEDGCMLSQLSPPSMTFPIQNALLHPDRAPGVEGPVDLARAFALEFRPVDEGRFPMMRLARETMRTGGAAPAVFNAANEVAVEAFLRSEIGYLAIPAVVEQVLGGFHGFEAGDLAGVLAADARARAAASDAVRSHRR